MALTGPESRLQGVGCGRARIAGRTAVQVAELPAEGTEAAVRALLQGVDLVLDAVTGTGFKPPLRGVAVAVRDALRVAVNPVVAVDLPSGWDADSREEKSARRRFARMRW